MLKYFGSVHYSIILLVIDECICVCMHICTGPNPDKMTDQLLIWVPKKRCDKNFYGSFINLLFLELFVVNR